MRKFYSGSDDGYDAMKDDRDGYLSVQWELDRQAEETARKNAELDRKRTEENKI